MAGRLKFFKKTKEQIMKEQEDEKRKKEEDRKIIQKLILELINKNPYQGQNTQKHPIIHQKTANKDDKGKNDKGNRFNRYMKINAINLQEKKEQPTNKITFPRGIVGKETNQLEKKEQPTKKINFTRGIVGKETNQEVKEGSKYNMLNRIQFKKKPQDTKEQDTKKMTNDVENIDNKISSKIKKLFTKIPQNPIFAYDASMEAPNKNFKPWEVEDKSLNNSFNINEYVKQQNKEKEKPTTTQPKKVGNFKIPTKPHLKNLKNLKIIFFKNNIKIPK